MYIYKDTKSENGYYRSSTLDHMAFRVGQRIVYFTMVSTNVLREKTGPGKALKVLPKGIICIHSLRVACVFIQLTMPSRSCISVSISECQGAHSYGINTTCYTR